MKFLKRLLQNFMAIASAEVELDQRGLVLIQGVNSDAVPHQVMALESQL